MHKRLGVALPIWLGLVSAVLMMWDIHNQRVILAMGMAWDTGAPVWPYQTANILFFAINVPAYVLANPISRVFHLYVPVDYVFRFPLVIGWWWFIGTIVDHGLPNKNIRRRWLWFGVSAVLAVVFVLTGIYISRESFGWWRAFGGTAPAALLFLSDIAPTIWCFVFAAASVATAKRLATG